MNFKAFTKKIIVPIVGLAALIFAASALFAAGEAPGPKKEAPAPKPPAAAPSDMVILPYANIVTVEIKAPVDKVFKYLEDFNNDPQWFPHIKSITNVKGKGLGTTCHWTLEREDVGKLEGEAIMTAYVPNQRLEVIDSGATHWTMLLQSTADKGSLLSIVEETSLKVPADEAAWAGKIKQQFDYIQGYANNVKTIMEKPAEPKKPAAETKKTAPEPKKETEPKKK